MAPPQATLHQGPPKNTMSATTSPAQLNQPAETAAPETRSLSKAAHTAYRIYKWLCLKARIKPVMSLRRKRGKGKDQRVAEAGAEAEDEDEDDIWTPEVYVYLLVGGHEVRATVNVIFDTGSLENIISTSCLREGFHGFAYSRSVGERIGTSLTGCEELLSIATIDIRWRGRNNRAQRPSIGPNYRYRVETSTCHVVESDEFDLIIGRPTINRLKLFTRNTDIFGGFRGVNKVKAENVEQEQKTADAQRDRAKEIKKLREKQEKEKKEAMKSTQQC